MADKYVEVVTRQYLDSLGVFAQGGLRAGTRAARLAFEVPNDTITIWAETDTGKTVTYLPGIGWRGPNGEDIDNPAPSAPDTGGY